jgi:uncharacterized membrane protein
MTGRDILRAGDIRRLVAFAVVLLVIVPVSAWLAGGFSHWEGASWRFGIDAAVFAAAPFATRIHAVVILSLVVTGWMMLALPKGDRRHRILGWTWVGAMGLMGLSSLAVPHGDSWVAAYVGGGSALALVLMTLLSLLPGRLMHDVVFGG